MVRMPMVSLLGAAVVLAACSPSVQSPTSEKFEQFSAEDPDERIVVLLTPEQRIHVLEEMNQFLRSTQEIVEGIALGDDALIQSAVSDGLGRGQGQGQTKGALPLEFRQMGSAMKLELKKIDTLSKSGADDAAILEQLSSTLMYCQSCHGSYQIRLNGDL